MIARPDTTLDAQARFFTTLLPGTALAVALLAQVSPARAEVVTLVCQDTNTSDSMTIRVDYDRKIVDFLQSDGAVVYSAAARITEGAVEWYAALRSTGQPHDAANPFFGGSLNRLSGQGLVQIPHNGRRSNESVTIGVSGPCRRATQKF